MCIYIYIYICIYVKLAGNPRGPLRLSQPAQTEARRLGANELGGTTCLITCLIEFPALLITFEENLC